MRTLRSAAVMDRTPQVLPVRSLDAALPLYRDGLGFALVQMTSLTATLEMTETGERLDLYVAPGRGSAEITVDDVAGAVAAVLRKGGEVRSSILNLSTDRHVVCVDLDGNRIDLIERTAVDRS
jgi:predicted enzyme related to lactoylglutathione lyase